MCSSDLYLLQLKHHSQRKKLDNFEGETYCPVSVGVEFLSDSGEPNGETVDANVYMWNRGPGSAFERGMAATNVRRYEVGGLA